MTPRVIIAGAGPAGLSAAYQLSSHGVESTVIEELGSGGGLSRTVEYRGYRFDIGGHRFYTHVDLIEGLWRQILGDEFLVRPRLSRIYYRGRYYRYPLEPLNALAQLGPVEAARCIASYLRARVSHPDPHANLENWMIAHFGRRLYEIFFQTYTEKVWGMPCHRIGADWAAQRIKGLSMKTLLLDSVLRIVGRSNGAPPKSLIAEFEYPRLGPGQMWEAVRERAEERGARFQFGSRVDTVRWRPGGVESFQTNDKRFEGTHFLSSMPIRDLLRALRPAPPKSVLRAAGDFNYRDFITVAVILDRRDVFPDNWIYVHDPAVKVGRIQNYKNWSPDMVPDESKTCLGLEYFCFEGDGLWTSSDADLLSRAAEELEYLGLAPADAVVDGTVLRVPKAYPVYDGTYRKGLATVRQFLEQIPNLQLIGRNGMHRYNNQDHAMLTGILAARNILGLGRHDLWDVNVDEEYVEDGFRLTPEQVEQMNASQPAVPALARGRDSSR